MLPHRGVLAYTTTRDSRQGGDKLRFLSGMRAPPRKAERYQLCEMERFISV
jgi:hypothetical protein